MTSKQQRKTAVPKPIARDGQVGGTHYKDMTIQPWDALEVWMEPSAFVEHLRATAITYLARAPRKGGMTDLAKAQHTLSKALEIARKHGLK